MKKRNILVAAMTLTLAGATLLSGCGLNADATLVNINKGEYITGLRQFRCQIYTVLV